MIMAHYTGKYNGRGYETDDEKKVIRPYLSAYFKSGSRGNNILVNFTKEQLEEIREWCDKMIPRMESV